MSERVVLMLPAAVFRRADTLARETGRPVADLLTEAIERSLPEAEEEAAASGLPWGWCKEREKVRRAVREYSEQIHADH